jgi:hypothetical protein
MTFWLMTPDSSDPSGSVASILAQKADLVVGSALDITKESARALSIANSSSSILLGMFR